MKQMNESLYLCVSHDQLASSGVGWFLSCRIRAITISCCLLTHSALGVITHGGITIQLEHYTATSKPQSDFSEADNKPSDADRPLSKQTWLTDRLMSVHIRFTILVILYNVIYLEVLEFDILFFIPLKFAFYHYKLCYKIT